MNGHNSFWIREFQLQQQSTRLAGCSQHGHCVLAREGSVAGHRRRPRKQSKRMVAVRGNRSYSSQCSIVVELLFNRIRDGIAIVRA